MKLKHLRNPQKTGRRNFALGLLLIAVSAIGVWWTVESNNKTNEYLIAAQAVSSGSTVSSSSFRAVKMNLEGSSDLYLKPGDLPPSAFLLVNVEAGQLIPKNLVSTAVIDARKPVVVTSKMPLPSTVKAGDFVDVWVSKATSNNVLLPSVQLVLGAEIVEIVEGGGLMSDQSQQVQILVPAESVAPIVDAVSTKSALSLVLQRNLTDD
ncbi:MAG: hypothetical protein ACKOUD_02065 [Rhodoluna sp.]